jgi:hypothetical protein
MIKDLVRLPYLIIGFVILLVKCLMAWSTTNKTKFMENFYETHSGVYEQSTACGSVPKAKQEHGLKQNIKDIQP